MNWAAAKDLRPVYPKFDDFKELREKLDPKGIFVNNYLRRIFGL